MERILTLWFRRIMGSLFFLGYIPVVATTVASASIPILLYIYREPLAPYLVPENGYAYFLALAVLTMFAIFITEDGINVFKSHEPTQAVFPAVVGQLTAYFLLPMTWRVLLLGFTLFQFFNIVKPYPIFRFNEIEGGVGITMGHVIAGVMTNVTLFSILQLFGLVNGYLQ